VNIFSWLFFSVRVKDNIEFNKLLQSKYVGSGYRGQGLQTVVGVIFLSLSVITLPLPHHLAILATTGKRLLSNRVAYPYTTHTERESLMSDMRLRENVTPTIALKLSGLLSPLVFYRLSLDRHIRSLIFWNFRVVCLFRPSFIFNRNISVFFPLHDTNHLTQNKWRSHHNKTQSFPIEPHSGSPSKISQWCIATIFPLGEICTLSRATICE